VSFGEWLSSHVEPKFQPKGRVAGKKVGEVLPGSCVVQPLGVHSNSFLFNFLEMQKKKYIYMVRYRSRRKSAGSRMTNPAQFAGTVLERFIIKNCLGGSQCGPFFNSGPNSHSRVKRFRGSERGFSKLQKYICSFEGTRERRREGNNKASTPSS